MDYQEIKLNKFRNVISFFSVLLLFLARKFILLKRYLDGA